MNKNQPISSQPLSNNEWNAELYDQKHSFVSGLGLDLLELLSPKMGEKILDIGCGTGHLSYKITGKGAKVIGIDNAPAMISQANSNYPNLEFQLQSADHLSFEQQFDGVFSNATLHWIKSEKEKVVAEIWRVLKPGGRFVAEFGGKGNVGEILKGIYEALDAAGYASNKELNPWYFPSIGEYASLLEKEGFELSFARMFPRPTPLLDGEKGWRNWIEMFAGCFFEGISGEDKLNLLADIEDRVRPKLYQNGTWFADYKRLRIMAFKQLIINN
ncbi:MAG: class I SAM-dependent methyltransferase [Cyanobacteriota bacterium]|nr:class I SAM-dependent methyltransferase [Cyanobacteriota bacterium]